jgi:hypothetical protein
MKCQFKGAFTESDKERLERAAARYERVQYPTATTLAPRWAFVHFETPYKGSLYWGVRAEDGYMVRARTARGLAAAVDAAREEKVRRRSQAIRKASRTVSRSIHPDAAVNR